MQDQNSKCRPYIPLDPKKWEEEWLKKCCLRTDPQDPTGCDCCYDHWTVELKNTSLLHQIAKEKADQKQVVLDFFTEKRDMLKSWYEDLLKADEAARKICGRFEVLASQMTIGHTNSRYTIKAIKYLFCMIKDFYLRLDRLKALYNKLWDCIKCLNHPEVNSSGVYKALVAYNEKLEALLKTADTLIALIIKAIRIANRVEQELSNDYGLKNVVICWQDKLQCAGNTPTTDNNNNDTDIDVICNPTDCKFEVPVVTFPIAQSAYFKKIRRLYLCHVKLSKDTMVDLHKLNVEKEKLLTQYQSLKKAVEETNPKSLCN